MLTLLMCLLSGPALAQPLINGDFSDGLTHWTVVASGGSSPGEVVLVEGDAELREGGSFVVSLEQSMVLEQALASVSFTIQTTPGFDPGQDFIPDVFEATLMTDDGLPALEGWKATTTAFFSLQEDGTAHLAPGVTFDGTTVTADLSPIKVGTTLVLSFALIGGDKDATSAVRVGDVVVVLANQPPVADAGDDASIECGATLTLDGSESSDPNGDTLVAAWTDSAGKTVGNTLTVALIPELGAETYTLTTVDGHGESDSDDVTITVEDTTAPGLPDLEDLTISAGAACQGAVPDLLAGKAVTEICGGLIVTQDPPSGAALVLGPNPVTVTVADGAGNETKATVIVTLVDDTPPSFDPPSPLTLAVDAACVAEVPELGANIVGLDNCSAVVFTQASVGAIHLGANTVVLTATDEAGNPTESDVLVTLEDTTPPSVEPLDPQTVSASATCDGQVPSLIGLLQVTENCPGTPEIVQAVEEGTALTVGTPVTVNFIIKDASGNQTEMETTITLVDELDPVLGNVPDAVEIPVDEACAAVMPDLLGDLTAGDNCADVQLSQSAAVGTPLTLGQPVVVTISATDGGATVTAEVTVTAVDSTGPVFHPESLAPAMVVADAACAGVMPTLAATATDACGDAAVTQNVEAGAALTLADATSVTLTSIDAAGNKTTADVTVTLVDVTPPTITTLPAGRDIPAEAGCLGAIPDLRSEVVATDNCPGELTITQTPLEGALQNKGDEETLNFTAADLAGNAAGPETATVTLVDPSGACGDQGTPDNGPEESEPPEMPDTDPDTSGGGGHNSDDGAVVEQEPPPIEPLPDGCGCRLAPGGPAPVPLGPAIGLLFAGAWLVRRRNIC